MDPCYEFIFEKNNEILDLVFLTSRYINLRRYKIMNILHIMQTQIILRKIRKDFFRMQGHKRMQVLAAMRQIWFQGFWRQIVGQDRFTEV